MNELYIIGTGSFAREVADLAIDCQYQPIFLAKDVEEQVNYFCKPYRNIACRAEEEFLLSINKDHANKIKYVIGIGNPNLRKTIAEKYSTYPSFYAEVLIHPSVINIYELICKEVRIGAGSLIAKGCILTNRISIGNHCILNLSCTVGHDVIIKDYSEISPGCSLNGFTTIGSLCSLGSGTISVPEAQVCDNVIVGAGAVIRGKITEPGTYVGIPAKKIK